MGAFFTNTQVYLSDRNPEEVRTNIIQAIWDWAKKEKYIEVNEGEDSDCTIVVGPVGQEPWITVYDQCAEEQNPEILNRLAIRLSSDVKTVAVSVVVHDSDVLYLELYVEGELNDTYCSYPDYFGEVNTRNRNALKGRPEKWEKYLIGGITTKKLGSIWKAKEIFVEDTLAKTAEALGWNKKHVLTGYNYLAENELPGLTYLKFRQAVRDFQPANLELPFLRMTGGSFQKEASVGEKARILLSFCNVGCKSNGLNLIFWGQAIEEDFVDLDQAGLGTHMRKNDGDEHLHIEQSLEKATGQNGEKLRITEFPDFPLYSKKYLKNEYHFTIYPEIKFKKAGIAKLNIGIVPVENRNGALVHTTEFTVNSAPRTPLRIYKNQIDSVLYNNLRAINKKETLFGLVIVNDVSADTLKLIIGTLQKWHQLLTLFHKGFYLSELQSGLNGKSKRKKIDAKNLFKSSFWNRMEIDLETSFKARFAFYNKEIEEANYYDSIPPNGFSFIKGFKSVPHINFWLKTSGLENDQLDIATTVLGEIIDGLMANAGIQAIMGKWEYGYFGNRFSTPYESVCGVNNCSKTNSIGWCKNFLRGVTETVWLGPELIAKVSIEDLVRICKMKTIESCARASLNDMYTLDDLEKALYPITSGHEDCIEKIP